MKKNAIMVSVVIGLLLMVTVTPRFISPDNKLEALPQMLIDHVDNSTVMYVKGIGIFRFQNVTMEMTYWEAGAEVTRLEHRTNQYFPMFSINDSTADYFEMKSNVYIENSIFTFNCTISVQPDSENPGQDMIVVKDRYGRELTWREGGLEYIRNFWKVEE